MKPNFKKFVFFYQSSPVGEDAQYRYQFSEEGDYGEAVDRCKKQLKERHPEIKDWYPVLSYLMSDKGKQL